MYLDLTVTYGNSYKILPVSPDNNLYKITQLIYQSFNINRRIKLSLFNHKYDLLDYSNYEADLKQFKFIAVYHFNIFHLKLKYLSSVCFYYDLQSISNILQSCKSNYNLYRNYFSQYFNLDKVFKAQFKSLYQGFIITEYNYSLYVGYGRNQDVSNDFWEYSSSTLCWKKLKSPDLRASPRYDPVWMKSKSKIYIYGGKNKTGHHLSDMWSLDLNKLIAFQNVKLFAKSKEEITNIADSFQRQNAKNNPRFAINRHYTKYKNNISELQQHRRNSDYDTSFKNVMAEELDSSLQNYKDSAQNQGKFIVDYMNYRYYSNLMYFMESQYYSLSAAQKTYFEAIKEVLLIFSEMKKKIKNAKAINDLYNDSLGIGGRERPKFEFWKDLRNFYYNWKQFHKVSATSMALMTLNTLRGVSECEANPYTQLPVSDSDEIDGVRMCTDGTFFVYLYGGYSLSNTQFPDTIKSYDCHSNMIKELPVRVKGRRLHIFSYLNKKLYAGFGRRNFSLNDLHVVDLLKNNVHTVEFDANLDYVSLNHVNKMQNGKQNLMIFGGEDGIVISVISSANINIKLKKENCLVAYNDRFINSECRTLFYFHGHLWLRAELTDYYNKMLFSITEEEL